MKKKDLRILLWPFSLLYAGITLVRNKLYDWQILDSVNFEIPVINVGNLRIGGTGKTPQVEYLVNLLKQHYKVAVISRGYKRKTKGYILAGPGATPQTIGDEPYQIYKKFGEDIIVAVGEDRAEAIRKVLDNFSPQVILLDDAFQHRHVKSGLNLLLTPFDYPFYDDLVLPAGNLREPKKGANRADIVLVTKAPKSIAKADENKIKQNINLYSNAPVYFSSIVYAPEIYRKNEAISLTDLQEFEVLLITGIANPGPLYSFLSEKNINFESLKFGDHHHFSQADIAAINTRFKRLKGPKKLILTTEKDYVRLSPLINEKLYYLPIQTKIWNEKQFNLKILDYVRDYK